MASNDFTGGVWRTVGGRRIFIKEGSDLTTAMKESGKFTNKKNEIEKLQKEYDSIKDMFSPKKAELRDKINALKEGKEVETYKKEQKIKESKQKQEYLKEKEKERKKHEKEVRERNEQKYKDIKVEEKNAEDLKEPEEGYVRLYRGLNEKFDKYYDRTSIDNSNGYESWTDNPNLAKAYGKNVYYMDIPQKDIGSEIMNKDGERYMSYVHDKKVGLKGQSGKEYMIYTDHNKYLKSTYTKITGDFNKMYLNSYNKYMKEHPNSKMTFNDFKKQYEN